MTTRGAEYGPVKVAGLFDKDSYELRFRKVGVTTKDSTSPCFCRRLSTFTNLSVVCPGKMSQIMTTIDLKTLLGMAIKTQRTSLGISQEELAYRAGLHRTYVSDLERGVRNPSVDSIGKLARALEVSVSDFFEKASDGNGSDQIVEILFVRDNADDVELTNRAFAKANITNPGHVVRGGAKALDFLFRRRPIHSPAQCSLPAADSARSKSAKKKRARSLAGDQSG